MQQHNLAKWYTDREAFLHDPEIDVVYVASPNSLHYQWSLDALNAGKGVICEKPFVATHAQCETLRNLAQQKGLFLVEAITIPSLPNFKLLHQHLDKIGPMGWFNSIFRNTPANTVLEGKNGMSSTSLLRRRYGCQLLQLRFMLDLFGEPEDIHYLANLAENGIDTSGVLTLRIQVSSGGWEQKIAAVRTWSRSRVKRAT